MKFILFFILIINSFAKDSKTIDYLLEYSQKDDKNISYEYNKYLKSYEKSLATYKNIILDKWGYVDISTNNKLVEYTNNYHYKKIIDYKHKILTVEIIDNSEDEKKDISKTIRKLYQDILKYTNYDIFDNNILNKKIYKNLNQQSDAPIKKLYLVSDILDQKEKENIISEATLQSYKEFLYKNNHIYSCTIKLPNNIIFNKAKIYKNSIKHYAKKYNVDKNLVFSMIHNLSYFNINAFKDGVRFGLMQITLNQIARKSYLELYGYDKLLKSRYLFNPKHNIMLGTKYLSYLYNVQFKNIKDEKSKLYLTIVAYNTNVKLIQNIFKNHHINDMLSSQVYKRLLRKIKNKDTKLYLSKVLIMLKQYQKLDF
jgi:hypothetical protein